MCVCVCRSKPVLVMGKHNRRIIAGDWNSRVCLLCLGVSRGSGIKKKRGWQRCLAAFCIVRLSSGSRRQTPTHALNVLLVTVALTTTHYTMFVRRLRICLAL